MSLTPEQREQLCQEIGDMMARRQVKFDSEAEIHRATSAAKGAELEWEVTRDGQFESTRGAGEPAADLWLEKYHEFLRRDEELRPQIEADIEERKKLGTLGLLKRALGNLSDHP